MIYLKHFNDINLLENIKLIKGNKNSYKILDGRIMVGVVELIFDEADIDDYPIEGNYINIVGLQIIPEYRGKGYSKSFIDKVIELAKTKNIDTIVLDVEKSNLVANNLYKQYFRLYKTDGNYNHYFLKIK